jgi:transposase-like protein
MDMKTEAVSTGRRGRRFARRSAQEWSALVAAFAASGKSMEAFCGEHGLALSSCRRWHKRLRSDTTNEPRKTMATFLPIPLADSRPGAVEVQVGDVVVRIEGGHADRLINALVARLGGGR